MTWIWAELGVAAGSDRDAIRRAYARKLRVTHPEDNPEGFKRLRAAYESALAQADHAVHWGDFEEGKHDLEDVASSEFVTISEPLDRSEAPQKWHETTSERHEDDAEATALRTARDADLAALCRAMADLDSALRGVWRAPDADIETLFSQLLAAPALGEIAVREDVERAVARLIADTIPRSDAILAQAVAAFGWNDRDGGRRDHAVYEVLQRLEEWRLIAAFGKPRHPLHAAWRSLTRKPAWQPKWRLAAFSGGFVHGVRTLLGDFEPVSPGLHFSFDAASVERWRAFLAKPRLTGAMLMLALAVWIGAYFAFGTIPAQHDRMRYAVGGAIAVLGLIAPWIALRIARATHALEEAGGTRSATFRLGWAGAFAALALATTLLPPLPIASIAVTVTALLLLGWIVVAADPAARTRFWPALGRWAIASWAYAVFGIPAAATLPAPIQVMLGAAAMLATAIRVTMVEQVRQGIDRIAPGRPVLFATSVLVGIGALGALATWARVVMTQGADAALFVGASLTLLAMLPGLAVIDSRYRRWVFGAHIILVLAFVIVTAPLLPASDDRGAATNISQESVLDDIKRQRPNLDQLRSGNPATWAEITSAAGMRSRGEIDDHAMTIRIDDAVDTAYRARLPTAPALLVAEAQRIKLAELLELRNVSVAACARGDMTALKVWPESLRLRMRTNVYAVAAWPVATSPQTIGGQVAPAIELVTGAARIIDRPVATLAERLNSTAATAEVCDARIAMLQALVGYPDAVIAATVRVASRKKAGSRK